MPQNEILLGAAKAGDAQSRQPVTEPVAAPATAVATVRPKRKRGRPRQRSLVEQGEPPANQLETGYRAQRAESNEQLRAFFAQRLRQLRQEYGYSQIKLGQLAHISTSLVSRIEAGEIMPTLQTTQNLAAAFGLSVSQLIEPELVRELVSVEGVDEEVAALLGELNGRPLSAMTRRLVAAIVEQILADNEQAEQD